MKINPAQMIGYRGITSKNLGSGLKAFSAEFCVPHAINAVKTAQKPHPVKTSELEKGFGSHAQNRCSYHATSRK